MTDAEAEELRQENAVLLKEKADALEKWHQYVRETLTRLSEKIAVIETNTNSTLHLHADVRKLEDRIKIIEDFKLKMVAIMGFAGLVITVGWKVIDHLWK